MFNHITTAQVMIEGTTDKGGYYYLLEDEPSIMLASLLVKIVSGTCMHVSYSLINFLALPIFTIQFCIHNNYYYIKEE